jgi:hypothetical protein
MHTSEDTGTLRDRAAKRIQKRRDFFTHLAVFVLVNTFLTAIWALTSPDGLFWPMFSIFGWGIGLVMHGWDVFVTPEISEADIDREIARMRRHDASG